MTASCAGGSASALSAEADRAYTDLRVLPSQDLATITLSMDCSASAACSLRLLPINSIALPARRRRASVSPTSTAVSVGVFAAAYYRYTHLGKGGNCRLAVALHPPLSHTALARSLHGNIGFGTRSRHLRAPPIHLAGRCRVHNKANNKIPTPHDG
jgi:hypothetical protein